MSEKLTLTVQAEEGGTRIDALLAGRLSGLSRSRLKALIEAGRVGVDGAVIAEPSHRVKPGQRILVDVPEAVSAEPEPEPIALDVLFEDEHLLVLDKPAGIVVHPAPGHAGGTLVNALLAHCGESLSGIGGVRRPGIVHRLDKDTSGLLIVACTDPVHERLVDARQRREVVRRYLALEPKRPNYLSRIREAVFVPADKMRASR
jgi:23S rRNA pseudouridine1911/1915/1917 synthase